MPGGGDHALDGRYGGLVRPPPRSETAVLGGQVGVFLRSAERADSIKALPNPDKPIRHGNKAAASDTKELSRPAVAPTTILRTKWSWDGKKCLCNSTTTSSIAWTDPPTSKGSAAQSYCDAAPLWFSKPLNTPTQTGPVRRPTGGCRRTQPSSRPHPDLPHRPHPSGRARRPHMGRPGTARWEAARLLLTRNAAIAVLTVITCAQVTRTIRGIRSEVEV